MAASKSIHDVIADADAATTTEVARGLCTCCSTPVEVRLVTSDLCPSGRWYDQDGNNHLVAARRRAHLTNPDVCRGCGATLDPQHEPVTVGGWYAGRLYTWRNGRLFLDDVRCVKCSRVSP